MSQCTLLNSAVLTVLLLVTLVWRTQFSAPDNSLYHRYEEKKVLTQYAECQNSKCYSLMLMAGPEIPVGNGQAVMHFRRKDIVPVLALKKKSKVFPTV